MSVDPDENTRYLLQQIQIENDIPNPYPVHKFHTTLIYSKKPCSWPRTNPGKMFRGQFLKYEVFKTQDGKNCLVARIDSSDLEQRHEALMKEMDASYDFDKYLPHITLSYDIGDYDIKRLTSPKTGAMFFSNERCQALIQGYD